MPGTSDKKKKTTASKKERRQAKKSFLSNKLRMAIDKFGGKNPEFPTSKSELLHGGLKWSTIKQNFKTSLTEFNKKLGEEIEEIEKVEKGKKSASKPYLEKMKNECTALIVKCNNIGKPPTSGAEHIEDGQYEEFCKAIDPLKEKIDRTRKKMFLRSSRLHSKKVKEELQRFSEILKQLKKTYGILRVDTKAKKK